MNARGPFAISRRKFLGQASCAAIGATTVFSTLFNLRALNAAATVNGIAGAKQGDYKALVCLLNAGGMDSFNMLVPRSNEGYKQYLSTRSNMALSMGEIRPLVSADSHSDGYGLHPSLKEMQQFFASGKLAFVSNIGTLVRPINKQEFYNGLVPSPLGLYSHSDQIMQWQTGLPDKRESKGWGGKIADLLVASNANQTVSMNISLSGSNIYQTGENTVEYSLHPTRGSAGIIDYQNQDWLLNQLRRKAIDGMVALPYQDVFKRTYINTVKTAIDGNEMLSNILTNAPQFTVPFDQESDLSSSFAMIARTIAGREKLKMSRQIFFVEFGGWDHHDKLLDSQRDMFAELDRALFSFQSALEELGVADQVTTFSMSEFSRTLTSNGNGTDHAWGGNVFVLGGAVKGQRIFGKYPSLALGANNPQEVGGGSLIPTISTDAYFAELALWYGVSPSDLALLFPNIGYFSDVGSGSMPIGFLG
jgi:uncharacterized protein (DUF1501 family)